MILESTLLNNFASDYDYFNPIALNDKVCFLQVNKNKKDPKETKEAKSFSYKLRLNSFDLEEEKL